MSDARRSFNRGLPGDGRLPLGGVYTQTRRLYLPALAGHRGACIRPPWAVWQSQAKRPSLGMSPHFQFSNSEGAGSRPPAQPRRPSASIPEYYFALSGHAARRAGILGPRPLAWAEVVRPFGGSLWHQQRQQPGVRQNIRDKFRAGIGDPLLDS